MISTITIIPMFAEYYLGRLIKIDAKEFILINREIVKSKSLCKKQKKISTYNNLSYSLNNCKYVT
ncbi:hypothetical protein [Candidatus Pelagibacter sp. RS40]|uniref:hypothetical protein n=1 Tax=Candidatus Pelagibacter sp. RS40 TaxID=1977865 RepID=UPI000A14C2AE|nr:hypothetical protein [Candidatus Pelagibacter sp. RS40]ARJ49530.1 hypothetical protein B8063_05805 [Candidatus Pelagibacter sp. RS40]